MFLRLFLAWFLTGEYSFVDKCTASHRVSVRRQNSSALQGRWPVGPEGIPIYAVILHGERNGHYGRRMVNGTVIMAAARRGESPFGLADSEIRVPGCEGSCVFSLKIKFF